MFALYKTDSKQNAINAKRCNLCRTEQKKNSARRKYVYYDQSKNLEDALMWRTKFPH